MPFPDRIVGWRVSAQFSIAPVVQWATDPACVDVSFSETILFDEDPRGRLDERISAEFDRAMREWRGPDAEALVREQARKDRDTGPGEGVES